MSRESDVTIFGATGFTGQRVVAEAVRSLPSNIRSAGKLQALAQQLEATARLQVLGGVNVHDAGSVAAMAQSTRLLLNCVGPFRHWGEGVVKACAEASTNYLDICGEPEFIERMELRYSAAAAVAGCLMASAAGFDSVPADMGVLFAARAFQPPAVPAAVEAVISVQAPKGTKIHYATWEAAVHGISSVAALHQLRREAMAVGVNKPPQLVGPRPKAAEGPAYDARVGRYTLPFPGADAAIVRRTQSALSAAGEPAVHFTARFAVSSAYTAAQFVVFGGLMMFLCKFSWGKALLLKYPGFFSHGGPTQAQMSTTTTTFNLFASGYNTKPRPGTAAGKPDKQVHAYVTMGDPGYLYTSIMLIQCAATLLEERQQLLQTVAEKGGVYTVGTLFRNSSLIERLNQHGIKFTIQQDSITKAHMHPCRSTLACMRGGS